VVRLGGRGNCTGALLAPNLVLSAKHCVAGIMGGPYSCDPQGNLVEDPDAGVVFVDAGVFGPVAAPEELVVGGNSPYSPHGKQILVSKGDSVCKSDMALVVLDRPVDDPEIVPVRSSAAPSVGEALIATGYGLVQGKELATVLQKREVSVIAVGPAEAVPGEAEALQVGFFAVGEALCSGDSGSPALAASGAVVGVASSVSRPDLLFPSGTTDDCTGAKVRGKYQATASEADLILSGYAAAGATPWKEGEPDPRAGLAGFGAPCASDAECRSNVCVASADGGLACSQGCLEKACPSGYVCQEVEQRLRCLPGAPAPAPHSAGRASEDDGCAIARADVQTIHPARWCAVVLALGAAWRRRRVRKLDAKTGGSRAVTRS
jgi:hypothetical protein